MRFLLFRIAGAAVHAIHHRQIEAIEAIEASENVEIVQITGSYYLTMKLMHSFMTSGFIRP